MAALGHIRRVDTNLVSTMYLGHLPPEWNPKLGRLIFSDAKLARAIENCRELFSVSDERLKT